MFMAGMALGSVLWGWIAGVTGVPVTMAISGGSIVIGILLTNRYPLREIPEVHVTPSLHWPLPDALRETHPDVGPVLVTIDYEIDPTRAEEFLHAIHALAPIRKRDGGMEWGIYSDPSHPGRFVETYLVESWAEHLRQHARFTFGDKDVEDQIRAFTSERNHRGHDTCSMAGEGISHRAALESGRPPRAVTPRRRPLDCGAQR